MFDDGLIGLQRAIRAFSDRFHRGTRLSERPVRGFVVDYFRSRHELLWENALLRKQLEVACRQIKRPKLRRADRAILVWLARIVSTWRHAVLLVQPETISAVAPTRVSAPLAPALEARRSQLVAPLRN